MEKGINRKRKLDEFILQQVYQEIPSKQPSQESFLKRLKTFRVFNWSGKPVDPPQCAKHGWEVIEKDVLKCVACNQIMSVSLPSPSKKESYKEACSKVKKRLTNSHSKFCLFATNPLPDSVLDIVSLSKAELCDYVHKQTLRFGSKDIMFETNRLEEIQCVFEWFKHTSSSQLTAKLSSFYLVLTGWELVDEECSVQCSYCNRKWCLDGHLINKSIDTAGSSDATPVNAVDQHQRWCAWRRPVGGWESRLSQLQQMRDSQNQQSQMRLRLQSPEYAKLTDGMRNIRRMLNGDITK